MSDQNPPAEVPEEESSGGLSLEAKAGLTLICLLAATFGYMVWQKWNEMQNSQVADNRNSPQARDDEHSGDQPPDVKEKLELVKPEKERSDDRTEPPKTASNDGETGNGNLPPTLNLDLPETDVKTENDPFSSIDPEQPARRPANIPTLDVPEEPGSNSVVESADSSNPFGDEFKPATEETASAGESATIGESTPPGEFDPFGPETEAAEPVATNSAEAFPVKELTETAPDQFSTEPEPETQPAEQEPDSFATAPDPFAEPEPQPSATETDATETETETPTLDFAESQPLPEEKPEPPATAEADPFGELKSEPDPFGEGSAEKHPLEAASEKPVKVTSGDSFQDPLPPLEPVPEQKIKPPADNPFGAFESIPAGAAQASSVTQVSPDPGESRRSGTLADLNAPSATNPSLDGNPFAASEAKPDADQFKLNPDGTYEIRQGDSYWIISRHAYGSARYYRALAEYNRKVIADPLQMTAGKKIMIPPVQQLERQLSHLIPKTPAAPSPEIVRTSAEQDAGFFTDSSGNPMYRVQENDTLTGISQRHLGRSSRWIQIYELNRDKLSNPNQLKIGTTLKLPGDASRVRIVRGQ